MNKEFPLLAGTE